MAPHRQMQMVVTRFERLSRRISLASFLSGHKAEEAIAAGRVKVDGTVATANFKVFSEASVTLDGAEVRPPGPLPKLWALLKPKKVLCQQDEKEGVATLRSLMRSWREREVKLFGQAQTIGLDDECLDDKHFIIVCGLAYGADGLVLLTNDGLFADAITHHQARILSEYDVKVSGDPPIDLLHSWRHGARAGGINYGRVFVSIVKRSPTATRLSVRFVESPDRPLEMLLDAARLRVNRVKRHAFGPYVSSQIIKNRLVQVPIHRDLMPLVPAADMRQVLVPSRGGVLSQDGRLRSVALEDSQILRTAATETAAADDYASGCGVGGDGVVDLSRGDDRESVACDQASLGSDVDTETPRGRRRRRSSRL
eukprot:TRINITY_DN75794_c0_g1_i1.p1 TRINITY_DN75794_c0_g1~~TRINITY_DN75794_c0_g1_i1.p1  ORF type:complete len:367 (-),score=62.16 TRINITY_DN75794_c0_g1_i1:139-1239(-)